jgi:hypothetical protein
VQALEEELSRRTRRSIRFLLAGDNTQALGEPAHTTAEALDRLPDWHCRAESSQLEDALAFASELAGELPALLVLTDRAPTTELGQGRVQWWAFGQPRSNLAFVNAARTPHEGQERCLFEIVNYAENTEETALVLETGEPASEWQRSTLRLRPRETRRVILTLPERMGSLRARIGEDNLTVDNQVTLLPSAERPVRIAVNFRDKALRELIDKGLRASHRAVVVMEQPDILFTDQDETPDAAGETWVIRVLSETNAVAYTGPFVLDRNHPLTEGLSLQGVVWGAGKEPKIPSSPVILAGDVPLVTDQETRTHGHELRLRLRPFLSTLPDAPGWPILLWNLLDWRASQKPGLQRSNYRLGQQVDITFATPLESVTIVRPDHSRLRLHALDRRVSVRAHEVGIWSLESDEQTTSFAVNALSGTESDLTGCSSGRWGEWLDDTSLRLEYQSVSWILLLLALILATVHLLLVARSRGRY